MRRYGMIGAALCLAAAPAAAQSVPDAAPAPNPAEVANGDSLTLAAGGALSPDYEGSDDYRLIPAGAIRGRYHGIAFYSRGLYLHADLIPDGPKFGFDAGPVVGLRFNRTGKVKDELVSLLPRRKMALEAGGFVGVSLHALTNPYDTLAFDVDVVHDLARAHRSTVVSPNLSFSTPLSLATYVSASLGAEFVSDRFADYYFGITPAESLASGLPTFDGRGGMKDWRAGLLLNQSLSGNLLHGVSAFGNVNYSRLVGDFKRSPIVAQRGSASQWLLAAGLAFTW